MIHRPSDSGARSRLLWK